MTIATSSTRTVSSIQLPVKEGQRVEFKPSAFFGPDPGKRQVETIAKEIAAFMNADGGDLYLGVNDDGFVTGIQNDLDALRQGSGATIVHGPGLDDSEWVDSFKNATQDAYGRKINQIVQGYLGKSACQWLGDADFQQTDDKLVYVRIPVLRAANGEVVLFQSGKWSELWVRTQGRIQCFRDRDRDQFVMRRARELASEENAEYRKSTDKKLADLMEAVSRMQQQPAAPTATVLEDVPVIVSNKDVPREIIESPCLVLRRGYDAHSNSTWVMDAFDQKEDGKFKYDRLELFHQGKGLSFIPYDYDCDRDERYRVIRWRDGYKRFYKFNFRIAELELLIERCHGYEQLAGNGFSFSDLKKGMSGDLSVAIWNSIDQAVLDAKPTSDKKVTLLLKKQVAFRAHTSDTFDSRSVNDPNEYKVVGVRFVKEHLFFCPDHLTDNEHYEFEKLNQDAFADKLGRLIEAAKLKGT